MPAATVWTDQAISINRKRFYQSFEELAGRLGFAPGAPMNNAMIMILKELDDIAASMDRARL
jgi:hypothetical protein